MFKAGIVQSHGRGVASHRSVSTGGWGRPAAVTSHGRRPERGHYSRPPARRQLPRQTDDELACPTSNAPATATAKATSIVGGARRGWGLGLSIVRWVAWAHGGTTGIKELGWFIPEGGESWSSKFHKGPYIYTVDGTRGFEVLKILKR